MVYETHQMWKHYLEPFFHHQVERLYYLPLSNSLYNHFPCKDIQGEVFVLNMYNTGK